MIDDDEAKGSGRDEHLQIPGVLVASSPTLDIDGDGRISPWESNLCRMCLIGALVIAFGDKVISGLV